MFPLAIYQLFISLIARGDIITGYNGHRKKRYRVFLFLVLAILYCNQALDMKEKIKVATNEKERKKIEKYMT